MGGWEGGREGGEREGEGGWKREEWGEREGEMSIDNTFRIFFGTRLP